MELEISKRNISINRSNFQLREIEPTDKIWFRRWGQKENAFRFFHKNKKHLLNFVKCIGGGMDIKIIVRCPGSSKRCSTFLMRTMQDYLLLVIGSDISKEINVLEI